MIPNFLKVKSRIDFLLVVKFLCDFVKTVDAKSTNDPERKAMKLNLQFLDVTRGPGLWKFNNSLLKDNEFIDVITRTYPFIREKYADIVDERLKWELIKM